MEILTTRRTMLANLQPGQYIDHIIFPRGNPLRVQSLVVRVETHCNFGRIWLISGPLNWQTLTYKYDIVIPLPQKNIQATPHTTTQRSLHAKEDLTMNAQDFLTYAFDLIFLGYGTLMLLDMIDRIGGEIWEIFCPEQTTTPQEDYMPRITQVSPGQLS